MKLHRMVTLEAQGPVPVGLTLDEIIKAGKVTNPYQSFVLGQLSEFFKNKSSCGKIKSVDLQLETPIDFESQATSTVVVNAIRALTPEKAVALAQYLKDCIQAGESALCDKDMDVVDWMNLVLRVQH